MKRNLSFYPRRTDSFRHAKFKMLRRFYPDMNTGLAMENRFWMLNDMIAESEGCVLQLSSKRDKACVADELYLTIDELESFIQVLSSPDVDLIRPAEGVDNGWTTEMVQEAFASVSAERDASRVRSKKRWEREKQQNGEKGGISAEDIPSHAEEPQSHAEDLSKQRKGKEIKKNSVAAPRRSVESESELQEKEFILRPDNVEFDVFVSLVKKLIQKENKSFHWKPVTGSFESDLRVLAYRTDDETKKRLLYEHYNIFKGKMNWLLVVEKTIILMLRQSRRTPIHAPLPFIQALLKKPNVLSSESFDGSLAPRVKGVLASHIDNVIPMAQ